MWYVYVYVYVCVCVLQFLMHANLIHVNTTVVVPTLPTGFNVDAMTNIQEAPALVGVSIPLIISPSHIS